jgi:hypothetical protein
VFIGKFKFFKIFVDKKINYAYIDIEQGFLRFRPETDTRKLIRKITKFLELKNV